MFNILGCMICLDSKPKFGLCQNVRTLRQGEGMCVPGWCATCDCFSSEKSYSDKTKDDEDILVLTPSGKVELGDLKPMYACCCSYSTIFFKTPDVFGCYRNTTCCCLKDEGVCCKPAVRKGDIFNGEFKIMSDSKCALIPITTCMMCVNQIMCCDTRAAFPCDGDFVPCGLNCFWINCCFDYKTACGCTYWSPMSQFMDGHKNMKDFKDGLPVGGDIEVNSFSSSAPPPTPTLVPNPIPIAAVPNPIPIAAAIPIAAVPMKGD